MEMAKWIKNEVGKETPWHITRFFPHYKLKNLLPTPIEDLESIYLLAREAGLEYVYLGNVPGHAYENTYCSKCNNLLIERYNYKVLSNFIINNNCRYCNYKIFGRFN
jgi:pyruvate formate lyase activating enzyme